MKKITALFLILSLTLCFAGCSGKEGAVSAEKNVEKTVNEYFEFLSGGMDDYAEFIEQSQKFYTPDGQKMQESEALLDTLERNQTEAAKVMGNEKLAAEIRTHIKNSIETSATYKTGDISVNGNEATVEYKCAKVSGYIMNYEFRDEFELKVSKYTDYKYDEQIYYFDEFLAEKSEKEQKDIVEDIYKSLKNDIIELADDLTRDKSNRKTTKRVMTLTKIDGKWLISSDTPQNKKAERNKIDPYFYEFSPEKQQPSENLDILTSKDWEYDFDGCAYELSLYKNGSFVNYCACGSPAGYSDMVEYYIYDDETQSIYMYDIEKQYIGKGVIKKISKDKLTIKKYGELCKYVAIGDLSHEISFPYLEYVS